MMRRLLLAGLALALLAAGCGLDENDGPQAIAPENLPPDLLDPNPSSSTTLTQSSGTTTVTVYFLEEVGDTTRLAAVERQVNDPLSPGERIAALFAPTTEAEADAGLTSSIPPDTVLISADEGAQENELVVNVSSELFSIQGPELAKAFAQIVWTVTERDGGGFRQVRFLVDGVARNALNAEGVEEEGPVARADYSSLAPG